MMAVANCPDTNTCYASQLNLRRYRIGKKVMENESKTEKATEYLNDYSSED